MAGNQHGSKTWLAENKALERRLAGGGGGSFARSLDRGKY